MSEPAVEVLFCELCGTSVPAGDLAAGAAVRHQDKLVGGCCLPNLRAMLTGGGQNPAAGPGGAATPAGAAAGPGGGAGPGPTLTQPAAGGPGATAAPVRGGGEGRLMTVAVLILAAIAAATVFLDQKLTGADKALRTGQEQLLLAQRADSEVLQAVGVAMDSVGRRVDLDAISTRLSDRLAARDQSDAEIRQAIAALQQELATMRQELRLVAVQAGEVRPAIEGSREQFERRLREVQAAVAALGSKVAAEPAPAPPAAEPPPPPGLAPALAEHVKKLTAADAAIRFEAVDELLRAKDAAVLPFLLPATRDADAYVRRLCVDGLRDWKRPEVVEALLLALTDNDENVRDTAWVSLKEVTGQRFPFETTGSKDVRARAIQKWQDWWDKSKATFGA